MDQKKPMMKKGWVRLNRGVIVCRKWGPVTLLLYSTMVPKQRGLGKSLSDLALVSLQFFNLASSADEPGW